MFGLLDQYTIPQQMNWMVCIAGEGRPPGSGRWEAVWYESWHHCHLVGIPVDMEVALACSALPAFGMSVFVKQSAHPDQGR